MNQMASMNSKCLQALRLYVCADVMCLCVCMCVDYKYTFVLSVCQLMCVCVIMFVQSG